MTQPYREADVVVPLTPSNAASPLVGFQQHARALATIGIYRQDIAFCTNATTLDVLKKRCRTLMYRSAEQQLLDHLRGFSVDSGLIDAAAWLQELTVDDLQYFHEAPREPVPPSRWLGVVALSTAAGFIAGFVVGYR